MSRRHTRKASISLSDIDDDEVDDDENITGTFEEVTAVKKEPVTLKKVMTRTITACVLTALYLGVSARVSVRVSVRVS
jgi:hypothetical protein